MNILVNSIDSLDNSFVISHWALKDKKQRANPQIRISTNIDKEAVKITIANNGKGMSDVLQSQIFQPFFSTEPKIHENKLGLAISYQIITENHCGKLQCVSSPEQGTEFIIQIPVS